MDNENFIQSNNNEKNKIDYLRVLESIKSNNGRLMDIASRFLENRELLEIVPAHFDSDFFAKGVNSIGNTDDQKIEIKGITINPEHMTEEIAVHELVHFFSMPALSAGFNAEQKHELDEIVENVKTYWIKTKMLWDYVKSKGYTAINNNSVHDTIVEFAVNFTNEQSEQKLKELNVYTALVDSFFEYYKSLKIKQD